VAGSSRRIIATAVLACQLNSLVPCCPLLLVRRGLDRVPRVLHQVALHDVARPRANLHGDGIDDVAVVSPAARTIYLLLGRP